jgi:demethylmenaquinone methyltransferase / 2-methoxy-6-polyprenyl-1,4-benzoquinol methylase
MIGFHSTAAEAFPKAPERYPLDVFSRAAERESAEEYGAAFAGNGIASAFMRFMLGPVGAFLINTPVFLLPRRLKIGREHRILDVGCGRASALRILASRIKFEHSPVGVDIAPAILERAREELGSQPAIDLTACAATRLPFADEAFDLIFCSYVVKHLDDAGMHRFLAETWRVLRPGGVLVVWEFAPTRSERLNRLHTWLLTPLIKTCRLRGYGDFVDLAIESPFANMENLDLRPFLFPPIPRAGFFLSKATKPAAE